MTKFYQKYLVILFIFFSIFSNAYANENLGKLIFASDIVRHGVRTTMDYHLKINYPPLWNNSEIPPGQLTSYGFYMEQQVGANLRKKYKDFFDFKYIKEQVCIRSDGSNRVIMSTLGILTTFFPDIKTKTLKIEIPKNSDNHLYAKKSSTLLAENLTVWKTYYDQKKLSVLAKKVKAKNLVNDQFSCETLSNQKQIYNQCL